MEENYKEFIAKIKYITEYDTSKTREENQLITESEELNEEDIPSLQKKIEDLEKKRDGVKNDFTGVMPSDEDMRYLDGINKEIDNLKDRIKKSSTEKGSNNQMGI